METGVSILSMKLCTSVFQYMQYSLHWNSKLYFLHSSSISVSLQTDFVTLKDSMQAEDAAVAMWCKVRWSEMPLERSDAVSWISAHVEEHLLSSIETFVFWKHREELIIVRFCRFSVLLCMCNPYFCGINQNWRSYRILCRINSRTLESLWFIWFSWQMALRSLLCLLCKGGTCFVLTGWDFWLCISKLPSRLLKYLVENIDHNWAAAVLPQSCNTLYLV